MKSKPAALDPKLRLGLVYCHQNVIYCHQNVVKMLFIKLAQKTVALQLLT